MGNLLLVGGLEHINGWKDSAVFPYVYIYIYMYVYIYIYIYNLVGALENQLNLVLSLLGGNDG